MSLLLKYSCSLLLLCSLFLVLEAQRSVASLGVVPVGTYSRRGWDGEREFISSIGGAKVAVYRKVHHPRPLAAVIPVPRYPPVRRNPPPVTRRPRPRPTKKPTGVSGRGGLLDGVIGGLIGGLLGGK